MLPPMKNEPETSAIHVWCLPNWGCLQVWNFKIFTQSCFADSPSRSKNQKCWTQKHFKDLLTSTYQVSLVHWRRHDAFVFLLLQRKACHANIANFEHLWKTRPIWKYTIFMNDTANPFEFSDSYRIILVIVLHLKNFIRRFEVVRSDAKRYQAATTLTFPTGWIKLIVSSNKHWSNTFY